MIAERKIPFDSEVQYLKTERVGKGLMRQAELVEKMGMLDQLVYGTDVVGTLDVHRMQPMELGWRAKRFGSHQALRHATGNCHELFKLCTYQNPYPEGEVGTLRKGSYADLLIVRENPLDNAAQIEDASNLLVIMKDGKLYKNTLQAPEAICHAKYPHLKYFPSDIWLDISPRVNRAETEEARGPVAHCHQTHLPAGQTRPGRATTGERAP